MRTGGLDRSQGSVSIKREKEGTTILSVLKTLNSTLVIVKTTFLGKRKEENT